MDAREAEALRLSEIAADDGTPPSELDFALARRAADLGWVSVAAVEAARLAEDADPGPGVVERLGLGEAQRLALEAPAFPADVTEALRDPVRSRGRFVLLARLGSGGMGEVWRAWDLRLARPVALKVLRRLGDERARACFEREARVLAALALPGVPAIHEIGEHGGVPHIAMQLVEGETLAALRKPLAPRRAAELVAAAARTVDAAHRAGIVHRDLKPSNLMLDGEGRLFVTDFGLARPLAESLLGSSLTGSAVLVGTPEYMPPEQARGGPDGAPAADARSDVYALGACLFDLVTGRPPFASRDRGEVIAQVLRDPPPRPAALVPGTPATLEAIALRCLEKDPARRYAGAGALADDLERFLAGVPVAARSPGGSRSVLRLAVAAGLFILVLVLVLGPGSSTSTSTSTSTTADAPEPVALWRGPRGGEVRALAADEQRIFATVRLPSSDRYAIASLPLGGGAAPAPLYTVPDVAVGIALAGDEVFWVDANSGSVDSESRAYRARKDGVGAPRVIFEGWPDRPPIEDACGIATDGRTLFVVDEVGGGVVRLDLDGGRIEPLLPARYGGGFATEHKNAIAVAGGRVFVADPGLKDVIEPEVVVAPAEGGPWRRLWSGPPLCGPRGIAVIGETVYVADPRAGNAVFALPADGGARPEVVRAGPPFVNILSVAAAGDALLVGDTGDHGDEYGYVIDGPPAIWRLDLGAGGR